MMNQSGGRTAWSVGRRWLTTNTFVPPWLPARWRHPAAGYLLAVLVQLVLAVITRQLIASFPDYSFPGVVETLTVALIAFSWGIGPAMFACLAGLAFEEVIVLPTPQGQSVPGDLIEIVLFLAVESPRD
jgi:hypothetical protein